jgi:hypothetical protein
VNLKNARCSNKYILSLFLNVNFKYEDYIHVKKIVVLICISHLKSLRGYRLGDEAIGVRLPAGIFPRTESNGSESFISHFQTVRLRTERSFK